MKPGTVNALPERVLREIVDSLKHGEYIADLSAFEAFDRWLRFNGIINYTGEIIQVWEILRKENK